MKEIPILFTTEMVQALLAGRKTMTRRIVKPKSAAFDIAMRKDGSNKWPRNLDEDERFISDMVCPYGQPGDTLYVRETWAPALGDIAFKADYSQSVLRENRNKGIWKPCIHMKKSVCRIWLKVKSVRVERLQDISKEDAINEGIEFIKSSYNNSHVYLDYEEKDWGVTQAIYCQHNPIYSFRSLWNLINGRFGNTAWNANPWVWVVEFDVMSRKDEPKS